MVLNGFPSFLRPPPPPHPGQQCSRTLLVTSRPPAAAAAVRRAQPLFRPLRSTPFPESPVPTLRHCSGLFGDLWILLPPTRPTVPAGLRFLLARPPSARFHQLGGFQTRPRALCLPRQPTSRFSFALHSETSPFPLSCFPPSRDTFPFLFFDVFPVSLPGRSALREEPTCERLE